VSCCGFLLGGFAPSGLARCSGAFLGGCAVETGVWRTKLKLLVGANSHLTKVSSVFP